jgi:DDE family transposase
LSHADSLRLICNGLKCCLGKLKHLGISEAPSKSGLSYANQKRPAALFQQLFWKTLERFRSQSMLGPSQKPFRFKNKLLLLDSTTISLCLSLFPWAQFKKVKGGVKAHVLLDHDDYMPRFIDFTGAFHSDVQAAHLLPVQRGSIIVMDRAYIDYDLWAKWITQGMFFVTRLRHDLKIKIIEERSVPKNRSIRRDQLISLSSLQGQKECPFPLRRVEVWNPEKQETIVLLTNHLTFGASTIADIYRQRWQIEVFFKTLKQNLKIKTFVGTSENALRIQIWTALIAMLLLRWLHFLSKRNWSFSNLAALLRMNLFTYRDLKDWLSDPLDTPPLQPQQLDLRWT